MFFSTAILILASCTASPTAEVKTNAATPTSKKLTLQLYSVRDDIATDYAGTIKKVGEMGFTAIEAAGYSEGKFYNRTPEEFKADITNAGMEVLSSHTNKPLTNKELMSKNFTEALKWWDEAIKAHKAAGMTYIVDPWMEVPKSLKDLQTYCEYFNEIGKRCKENGILFGYHNHAHEFQKVEDKVMFDYMLENTNPDYVFFQMDVYWVVRGQQSPVDYFEKYKGRFPLLHIKDNKELGQSGMVGFDAIFRNLETAGTKHLIVEVEKYSFTPLESVKKSFDYLVNSPFVK
jgi:sugar phosphate isomerase/epimerase